MVLTVRLRSVTIRTCYNVAIRMSDGIMLAGRGRQGKNGGFNKKFGLCFLLMRCMRVPQRPCSLRLLQPMRKASALV